MLSVLIPCQDDSINLEKTLNSLFETALNTEIEVIVIDDASRNKIELTEQFKSKVLLFRFEERIGPAQARQYAAQKARFPILISVDSHTDFSKNWDVNIINNFDINANTIGIIPIQLSNSWEKSKQKDAPVCFGSWIYITHPTKPNMLLDSEKIFNNHEEINCMKFASWVISKRFFEQIGGLRELKLYGSEEILLSLKTWLIGGRIEKINMKPFVHINTRIGVIRNLPTMYYNKLLIAKIFFDEFGYNVFLKTMPKHWSVDKALEMINIDKEKILSYKSFYSSIFINNWNWFLQKFLISDEKILNLHNKNIDIEKILALQQFENIYKINQTSILERFYLNTNQPPLSIIIPVLNDETELNLTIESIRNTCPYNIEIIVVDDGSDIPVQPKDLKIKLIRLNTRVGAGKARHIGAESATSKHLLFIDSHMRFVSEWLEKALDEIWDKPKTLWCSICSGLSEGNMDMNLPKAEYTGADFQLYEPKTGQVFEGVWTDRKNGNNYEIPCIMGACYFIHKDWFFHLKGLEYNKFWGYEEPFLSLKSWLAGGEVRLLTNVKIGHKFRNEASYTTDISYILYNKMRSMKVLFPPPLYDFLVSKIPLEYNFMMAHNLINQDTPNIITERQYYNNIFIHDIKWFCQKFSIPIPV